MNNLEYALKYASIGWKVLPCYEINNFGLCSCGKVDCHSPGKHPRTKHGLTEASTDQNVITIWWTQWPNANVAVATGAGSGIIAIDIDGPEGEKSLEGKELPPAFEQLTGGGGRHLVYAHPGNCALKSGAGLLHKVDSRADGGYIMVAGSNHKSGNFYEWRNPPWDDYPSAAPDWWLDLLVERKPKPSTINAPSQVAEGGRNNYLAQFAGKLRRAGHEYEEILSITQYHNAKTCKPPLDEDEVERICRSIAGYAIFTPEEEELIARGAKFADQLFAAWERERKAFLAQKKITKARIPAPEKFVPNSGLIKDIYDWIIGTSMYPLPYLAMAASVSFVSILMGQKFEGHTGIKPNLYMVGIAPSGSGKEHARACIDLLAHRAGLDNFIGGSRIASGSALISALEDNPVQLYQLDEFGLMLQLMTDERASGHKKELADMMMQFYTCEGIFRGTDYADRKLKKRKPIENPIVTIYGTSTPSEFYKALSTSAGDNGFLGRMTIIDGGDSEPNYSARKSEPPPWLIESVKKFHAYGGDVANNGHARAVVVNCPEDINKAFQDFNSSIRKHGDDTTQPIYRRATASLMKLALVFSVSMDYENPQITPECFALARDIVLWSLDVTVHAMHTHVADTEAERDSKFIENVIRKAGKDGISGSELYIKTRKIKKYDRENIISELKSAGIIGHKIVESDGRKPVTFWLHCDHVSQEIGEETSKK